MSLKIGTVIKALLILLGLVVSTETLAPFNEEFVNQLAGALALLVSVGYDAYETFKLKQAGIAKPDGSA